MRRGFEQTHIDSCFFFAKRCDPLRWKKYSNAIWPQLRSEGNRYHFSESPV